MTEDYALKELSQCDQKVEALCLNCTDYFLLHYEQAPMAEDALEIFTSLSVHKSLSDKSVLGLFHRGCDLAGIIDIVRVFPTDGQWMLGLMLLDPKARGKGLGRAAHTALVKWAKDQGAESLRIGVIKSNRNGIAFWSAMGYTKIKEVEMDFKEKRHGVLVMSMPI